MARVRTQLLAQLTEAAQAAATPLGGLAAVFKAHVDFVMAHPGVPRIIFHELQQPQDTAVKQQVRQLMQAYRQLLLGLLDAAVTQRQVPAATDREAAATMFVGIVQGLVMQALLSGQPAAMAAQADRVYAIFVRGLCEGA
jgi:hypothetical protein